MRPSGAQTSHVDERGIVGIHGIVCRTHGATTALTVQQHVNQIVGAGVIGAERVERVGHGTDNAQVIVVQRVKQRFAVNVLVDDIVGYDTLLTIRY